MQPIQINVQVNIGLNNELFTLLSSVINRLQTPVQMLPQAAAPSKEAPAAPQTEAPQPEAGNKPGAETGGKAGTDTGAATRTRRGSPGEAESIHGSRCTGGYG